MKVSYFETARYRAPRQLPAEWPVPPDAYDREAGAQSYRGMVERLKFVEKLGFDWISVAEHHYSPNRLTPNPIVSAAHLAGYAQKIKIAVLGPIVSQSNPVQVAEELAMLDNMLAGRLVVGMLRGITGEYLTYGLNPAEARERTTEAMELVLKAWTEPQPFGWQGRHFRFRTVAVWPRPRQQPYPPTYALGTSRESCEFAARHRLGLGVSYAPFDVIARATHYYREQCAQYGWQPSRDQIIYRANILIGATDADAEQLLEAQRGARRDFPLSPPVRDALLQLDQRNVAGVARTPNVGGVLPTNFVGSPDRIVDQIRRCREECGAGVLDLMFQLPGSADLSLLMRSLELFGTKVLPYIRVI
ncbi:MAG: LLM class flavin-dependent oxidoreductase [Alphaproteobacteria bacterium]|nr:LLM class flavin-dependent oxidoreductase [Alphaproteobacteria bacterium]